MNKIYKAFSKIIVSEELKQKTLLKMQSKIEQKNKKQRYNKVYFSLALTCSVMLMFVTGFNYFSRSSTPINNDNDVINIFTIETNENGFLYNNNLYKETDSVINLELLSKKIGVLTQIPLDLKLTQDFDSYHYNKGEVYTVKGVDDYNQLIIVYNDELILYIIDK